MLQGLQNLFSQLARRLFPKLFLTPIPREVLDYRPLFKVGQLAKFKFQQRLLLGNDIYVFDEGTIVLILKTRPLDLYVTVLHSEGQVWNTHPCNLAPLEVPCTR